MERDITDDPELMRLLEAVESGNLEELSHMLMLEFDDSDLHRALNLAAQLGRQDCFRLLLCEETNINALTSRKTSLLMTAVEYGNTEIVQQLLHRYSCDVNQVGQYGLTALHRASWQGHVDIASLLLDSGADMAAKDLSGDTPLIMAAQLGYVKLGELLLRRGCNINQPGQMGMTPLMVAAENGRLSFVDLLLSFGVNKDTKEKWLSNTALTLAAQKGHVEIVQTLLKAGSDPSAETLENMAAVHYAAKSGHLGCVRALLDHGVSPNVQTKHKYTPMLLAAENGHLLVLQFVVARGGDDAIALHRAAAKGNDKCLKFLLTLKYRTAHEDAHGNTPLLLATRMGYLSSVKILVDFGADIRFNHDQPLFEAVLNGQAKVVKYFLEKGANASAVSHDGVLPMYWPSCGDHADCIRLLANAGADLNRATSNGQVTPLILAIQRNQVNAVQALLDLKVDINFPGQMHPHDREPAVSPFELAIKLFLYRIIAMLVLANCDLSPYYQWEQKKALPPALTDCPPFLSWLQEEAAMQQSLKVICRHCILNYLGGCREELVKELPLPDIIKKYLIPPKWEESKLMYSADQSFFR